MLIPCFMFAYGVRYRRFGVIRLAAIMTVLGIILNRQNVCLIAYNWYVPNKYYPSWEEIIVTLTVVFVEIWVFRWVVTRMSVFSKE